MSEELDPHHDHALQIRMLIYGHLVSRAVCTLAELRVPDLLERGPTTADKLAAETGCRPGPLYRLLRTVSGFGLLADLGPSGFALTDLGRTLTSGHPAGALPTALIVGGEIGESWNALRESLREPAAAPGEPTAETAFAKVYGTDFFDYLAGHTSLREEFYRSQQAGMQLELERLREQVIPEKDSLVVDVGGGDGLLLAEILGRNPRTRGILLEQPAVIDAATERFAVAGLGGRCRAEAGDFFTAVPSGAGLYLMRHILHDWNDEDCVRILRTCRAAMTPSSRLVVVETLIETEAGSGAEDSRRLSLVMDLYMMAVVGGSERDRGQFAALLDQADLGIRDVAPVGPGAYAITAGVVR
jgi:O-methyltransferase domain/Dimerisation domain